MCIQTVEEKMGPWAAVLLITAFNSQYRPLSVSMVHHNNTRIL